MSKLLKWFRSKECNAMFAFLFAVLSVNFFIAGEGFIGGTCLCVALADIEIYLLKARLGE